ncbi:hypothetical protein FRC14_001136, partial [Serendipita sp. 396]
MEDGIRGGGDDDEDETAEQNQSFTVPVPSDRDLRRNQQFLFRLYGVPDGVPNQRRIVPKPKRVTRLASASASASHVHPMPNG